MIKSLLVVNIALASLLLFSSDTQSQTSEPWEDNKIFSINKEAPHASLFPFQSRDAALADSKEQSNNYLLLNGLWKFNWQRSPKNKPNAFETANFNDSKWQKIPVPGNWEAEGFGYPIYLDERFPFTTTWPDAPKEYNPIGSYRKSFALPKSWKNKQVFLHVGGDTSWGRLVHEQYTIPAKSYQYGFTLVPFRLSSSV